MRRSTYDRAMDKLSVKGARLMLMHCSSGKEFYVIPGGPVSQEDAQKILSRPDVVPFDDGLFPGNPQSWKIQR